MAEPWSNPTIVFATVLGGVLLLWAYHCKAGWREPFKARARLPKGSYGWPIIGETIAFARDPAKFTSSHVRRYGKIFKTCFLLEPGVIGTTPDFAKFVTSNTTLFEPGWPENLIKILGPKAFMVFDGPCHLLMKKLIQKPLLPEALRSQVNVLETIILEHMASWEERGTVMGSEATQKIMLDTGIWVLTGLRDIAGTQEGMDLEKSFRCMYKGAVAVPLNLPGTDYNKGLKAKKVVTQHFKNLIGKRRGEKINTPADTLGIILKAQADPQAPDRVKDLEDDVIADSLVLTWFAAFDAPATTLVWVLKFLNENPEVFRRIQAEQEEILKSKGVSFEGPRLSWDDIRKMVYAQKFFQEVQRILSIAPYIARKASQDVEYEGLLIPKGWAVRPVVSLIHQDPAIYPNPTRFDPDRFDETPKPYTYIPFSSGPHMCPGMEFTMVIVLIFIHHLATSYIHESAAPDKGTEYKFFPRIIGGYPVTLRRRI